MDGWEKFSDTLLPKKENFYRQITGMQEFVKILKQKN